MKLKKINCDNCRNYKMDNVYNNNNNSNDREIRKNVRYRIIMIIIDDNERSESKLSITDR